VLPCGRGENAHGGVQSGGRGHSRRSAFERACAGRRIVFCRLPFAWIVSGDSRAPDQARRSRALSGDRDHARFRGKPIGYSGAIKPIEPLLIPRREGRLDSGRAVPKARRGEPGRGLPGGYPGLPRCLPLIRQRQPEPLQPEPRTNANSPTGKEATTGGNPAAWADAKEQGAGVFCPSPGGPTVRAFTVKLRRSRLRPL
jgi:hypothetical protein